MAIVLAEPRSLRGTVAPIAGFLRALLPIVVTSFPLLLIVYIACSPYFGLRIALTFLLLILFCGLAVLRPVYAILAAISFTPWIGIIRRIFDAELGPAGLDPILAVVPLALCLAFFSTCLSRTGALRDMLRRSLTLRLVLAFTALLTIEAANPLQGGIGVIFGGAMYRLFPLFVVFIMVAVPRPFGPWVMRTVLIVGALQASYGLWQTFVGFTGFEEQFIDRALISGYRSISVGGVIRAFGTFVSAAEYVYYLDVMVGIAFGYAVASLRRRSWGVALLCLAICALGVTAIIFESHRLSLLLLTAMVLFVLAVNQRNLVRAVGILVVLALAGFAVWRLFPSGLGAGAINRLLDHLFGSLSGDNLLKDQSFQGHIGLLLNALWTGVTSPLGRGLGAASQAAQKFDGGTISSEFDVTDIVIASGYIGGSLYVLILVRLLWTAARLYRRTGRPDYLAAGAGIVAGIGQILGPGYYAFCITLLAIAAWLIQEEVRHTRHRHFA
jgi:hypothetical protein